MKKFLYTCMERHPRICCRLIVLIDPVRWLRTDSTYNKQWDKTLWDSLIAEQFGDVGKFRAIIGDHQVWIENAPYGNGTTKLGGPEVKCSRATAVFLEHKLKKCEVFTILTGRNKEPRPASWA